MTHQQALREDTCTFPSYTLPLHKRCAAHIDKLEADVSDMAEVVASMEAELSQAWDINEKLLRLLPNNAEALELTKEVWHSTEGQ